jgi:SCO1/SenC
MAILIRRTLVRTDAPILRSLRRIVPQVALANCVCLRPMRRSAHIGHRSKIKPQLIGAHGCRRGAVGEEIELALLNAVFHLSARAIELFVKTSRLAFRRREGSDYEAGIGFAFLFVTLRFSRRDVRMLAPRPSQACPRGSMRLAPMPTSLFISIDPERDTSAHLKEYLSSFDPRIRGLTGTDDQIAAVAKEYRIYYKRIQLEEGGYAMDHTAVIYLMDRAGRFVDAISLQTDDKIAIERLRQLAAL